MNKFSAEEYLIMLKEDESFRQYIDGDEEERNRPRIIKRDIAEKTKEQNCHGSGISTWYLGLCRREATLGSAMLNNKYFLDEPNSVLPHHLI